MSEIDRLLRNYERHVRIPWEPGLAGAEKVWFAVYDPAQERRLRFRLQEFETATRQAGYGWSALDLTHCFGHWLAGLRYRESYFAQPERLASLYGDFLDALAAKVIAALQAADERTVVALTGVAALFGVTRVSALIERLEQHIRGYLLVFFPGQREGNSYRLLDARDGWNYRAVAITADEELDARW
jgi:hypothetical protein